MLGYWYLYQRLGIPFIFPIFLYILIILYYVKFFPLTRFGDFTSYIFPVLLFANCNTIAKTASAEPGKLLLAKSLINVLFFTLYWFHSQSVYVRTTFAIQNWDPSKKVEIWRPTKTNGIGNTEGDCGRRY